MPPTPDATIRLSNVASVPAVFIELTSIAVANHMALVRAEGRTPEQVRDLVAYADAYGPLSDELEALAKFVRYSTTVARNIAGAEALTTYALAQRLAKRPETAYLAPYADDMRRALGRGRKKSPEELAKKAAERAAKAAAKAAIAAAKAGKPVPVPEPDPKPQKS
jgi:alkylhydroperoxidase family enzyme